MHALLETLRQADLGLFYKINSGWTAPLLDRIMPVVSSPNVFAIPVLVAVLGFLIFGKFRERLFLVLIALALLVGDAGVTNWGKKFVHRARPNEVLDGVRVVAPEGVSWAWPISHAGGRSFPSGHACNNVALAMMACAVYGRRAAWLWLWAALVGYSRVYLGAHYPSDILGSALLSVAYSWIIVAAARWAWRRWAASLMPKLAAAHPGLTSSSALASRSGLR